ncbi:MAG: MerR family DNA-binding transcriptional regulator [Proteobacteria bacterium]|nr:MAG: MerR family DNA-binding transcriptional regulator [Pseudomonadota bacterium]QKK11438.1 MAG: MerR family DNA-binding transcriptional regulator [Pseudomonadota bacterium]
MEPSTPDFYTVTELADELGITPRTIRFYETKALIKPRRAGTTRVYTHRERARMQLILRGKRLGFSLADIREYLDLYDADPLQGKQLRLLTQKIDRRISELEQQREDLETALQELQEIRQECLTTIEMRERTETVEG